MTRDQQRLADYHYAVAHGYFKVDLEIVWKTIHADLSGLHTQVQKIKQALPSEH